MPPAGRRLDAILLTLVSLSASCCGARDARAACEEFPVVAGRCVDAHLESDPQGDAVCACPVVIPDDPFCTPPDPRAPLSATCVTAADPGHQVFGSYPDLSSLPAGECPSAGDWSLFGPAVAPSGQVELAADDLAYVEPAFSPDSTLFAAWIHTGTDTVGTVAGCQRGADPGWVAEGVLGTLTAPFLRWGSATGEERTLYVVADDVFRVTLSDTPQMVLVGQDPAQPAVVLRDVALVARSEDGSLAIGDYDVSFRDLGGGQHEDAYLAFMSALAAWPWPVYLESGIYLSDLTDCDPGCAAQADMRFCCRTAFIADGDTEEPGLPTNPALTADGRWLAFNRFTSWDECPLCAQVHVLKNPFEDAAVMAAACVQDGDHDGFHQPIDCSALTMAGGAFDDSRCPNYHCCDQTGIDCGTCVTIGERTGETPQCDYDPDGLRERNYLAFFDLDDTTFLAFRSADLMGDQQQDLHIYEVGLDGDGAFRIPADDAGYPRVIEVAGFSGSDGTLFGPAPYRKVFDPGENPCGDDDDSGDDDSADPADDDDSADPADDDDADDGRRRLPGCACTSTAGRTPAAAWIGALALLAALRLGARSRRRPRG